MSGSLEEHSPDKIKNCPHPRETQDLYGHEHAETAFLTAICANKLHHAWLLEGPKGVGKASLAYRVARRLLGTEPDPNNGILGAKETDPLVRQIAVASFPDLMTITNGWSEKTKKWNHEINVDQVRKISHLFANRAAGNGWRVCIIDCADDLNHNAANALLKTLEEPPKQGLLLLVCHKPGRLLATLRSRCRRLQLRAPGVETAKRVAIGCGATEKDAHAAAVLAKGSPGRAAEIANANGLELWAEIEGFFDQFPRLNQAKSYELAHRLAAKGAVQARALFLDLLQIRLEKEIHDRAVANQTNSISPWLQALEANQSLANDIGRINLDPAMTIVQLVTNIQQAFAASERQLAGV